MIEIKETTNFEQLAELNEELQTFHHLQYPAIFKPFYKKDVLAFFEATLAKENVKALIAKSFDSYGKQQTTRLRSIIHHQFRRKSFSICENICSSGSNHGIESSQKQRNCKRFD